jgi:hypothetical protein
MFQNSLEFFKNLFVSYIRQLQHAETVEKRLSDLVDLPSVR